MSRKWGLSSPAYLVTKGVDESLEVFRSSFGEFKILVNCSSRMELCEEDLSELLSILKELNDDQ